MAGVQNLSGHILAKSLLPELKTSLKRSLGALVLVKNQKFRGKKLTFFFLPDRQLMSEKVYMALRGRTLYLELRHWPAVQLLSLHVHLNNLSHVWL